MRRLGASGPRMTQALAPGSEFEAARGLKAEAGYGLGLFGDRFTGALYKASSWTHVGTTQGRGRYDRHTRRDRPKKDIWIRLLRKDWRRTLNR